MNKNIIITSNSHNPWHNLALEEYLFDHIEDNTRILYLWQNDNTVVIGKSQNSWKECRVAALEEDGGYLARRTSGGGAVYHDLGNLCYTFIASSGLYNQEEQLGIILTSLSNLGIEAGFTGRNDIALRDGRKFSGNAFRFVKDKGLMHGTLLVDTDFEKMSKYLSVSKAKIAAKGVDSVKSRTVNLNSVNQNITVEALCDELRKVYSDKYGYCNIINEYDIIGQDTRGELKDIETRHSSWSWRLGQTPVFDVSFEKRFCWGGVELHMNVRQGVIQNLSAFTDSMEPELGALLTQAFTGRRLSYQSLREGISSVSEVLSCGDLLDAQLFVEDMVSWFEEIF